MSSVLERNGAPPKQGPNSNQNNRGHLGSRYLNISQWSRNLFPSPIPTKCLSDGKVPPKEHLISQAQVFSDWHHRKAPSVAAKAAARQGGHGGMGWVSIYLEKLSWTNWTNLGLSYQKILIHDTYIKFIESSCMYFFSISRSRGAVFVGFFSKKQPQA